MKKILLVLTLTTLIFACKKEDNKPSTPTTTIIEGCMDILALNYNQEATEDDGSCEYAAVEGCMDSTATNYNPEATEDDGSCEYLPTELILSGITINTMPLTNNGANWDVGLFGSENPDVFYVLKAGSDEIFSSSSQDNIDACPISFTENLPYTITDFSQEYTIELYDNDQIAGIGENELMGTCSFTPNESITAGGNTINITNSETAMTLAIQWIQ